MLEVEPKSARHLYRNPLEGGDIPFAYLLSDALSACSFHIKPDVLPNDMPETFIEWAITENLLFWNEQ